MKKTLYLLCTVIILLTGCSDSKKINPMLKATSEEANKQCPVQIDISTILTGTEVLPGDVLKYNYKLTTKKEVTDTVMAKKVFKNRILYQIKNNADLKPLRDLHTSFLYSYKDTNGKQLFQVEVTYAEYSKDKENDNRSDQEILAEIIPENVWFNKLLLPIQMDEITLLAECNFAAPDTIEMIYDLDDSKISFTEQNLPMLKEYLSKAQRADKASTQLMDKNVIFKHIYRAQSGKTYEVLITPADYK